MAVINTNVMSLSTQLNLSRSQGALGTAIERLSSGLRINSAKDDAAGSGIANRFTANIRGLDQARRNANDGISLSQTAEGALNEVNNNLQRMRELTVQARNGTNSSSDLKSIQAEINQRSQEIVRISAQTQFNNKKILGVDAKDLKVQVGANDQETITLSTVNLMGTSPHAVALGKVIGSSLTGSATLNVTTATFATDSSLDDIDLAISAIDEMRGDLGAIQNRFESTINNLGTTINNLSASRSRIQDADYALEVSNMTRAQILQQAGTSVLAQANQVPQTALSLLR